MKFLLDTNLYVRAFRNRDDAKALEHVYALNAPHVYLSSVVLHELLAGANTKGKARDIKKHLAEPFERAGRVLTPAHATWKTAGEVLAEMSRAGEIELRRVPKSFVHDVLMALSCREIGAVVVGDNQRDYERIQAYVAFQFIPPWPA